MSDTPRDVCLVCLGDDPRLADRLAAAAAREIAPTVFVRPGDTQAQRLALAAGAEIGSVFPDRSSATVLVTGAVLPTDAELAGHTVVTDRETTWPSARRMLRLIDHGPAGGDGVALTAWDAATLDGLAARGWRFRPAEEPPPPAARRLDGLRALHLTSVHRPDDGRILHKEVNCLREAGAEATVLGFTPRPSRAKRLPAGLRLVAEARRRRPDVVHVHDPELLPAAATLRRSSGIRVIYDAHEYLGQTTRTKRWIPQPMRVPTAVVAERLERLLAGQVDAVVTVTEDMAVGFARAGIDAVSVANYAPRERFPETAPADEPTVVYVGGIDPARGRDLMYEAFPMVDVPGARLLLAGPGDPGPLPPHVDYLGRIDYHDVPALLARARVVWNPMRRSPNWDRARATKVMEAMAAGRAIVTSDLRRTQALVQQSGCGIVVPFDEPGAHAGALTELLRDPGRCAVLGAAGRATFLTSLTFEREAAKLVALYARLTGTGGPA